MFKKGSRANLFLIALLILSTAFQGVGGSTAQAAGSIIYVKEGSSGDGTSWDTAFGILEEGLEQASDGDQIWIAQGIYYPTKLIDADDARTATFQMKNGVTIYGGFEGESENETVANRQIVEHETILSGDLGTKNDNSDNAYHVFFHPRDTDLNETAVLDGVTISGGNANRSSISPHSYGGGLYNYGSSPTLTNVTISDNYASGNGAGMYNEDSSPTLMNVKISKNRAAHLGGGISNVSNSSPVLTNVTLSENLGSGIYNKDSSPSLENVTLSGNKANSGSGMHNDNSNPVLENVTISGNTASVGGGMRNEDSSPVLENVTISGNTASVGGGMLNMDSNPILTNVMISENEANNGGGMYNSSSSPTLTTVTISENTATSYGGGVYNSGSSPTLTNVTLSGNTATRGGGGVYNSSSSPMILNSIIWGNVGEGIENDSSIPVISYSLVEGSYKGGGDWDPAFGTDGGNNLDAAPKFIDPANGNYRLQDDSPAIDKGNSRLVDDEAVDLDGNPRIIGTAVDMGAYENQTDTIAPTEPAIQLTSNGWTTEDTVTVTITPGVDEADGSGVEKTEYRIGSDGGWETYEVPFTVTNEGETTVYARTTDKAGNESDEAEILVQLDRTRPTIAFSVDGNETSQQSASTTVTVSDSGSGNDENSLRYSWTQDQTPPVDASHWTQLSNSDTLTKSHASGSWYLHIQAADLAGNKVTESSARFRLFIPSGGGWTPPANMISSSGGTIQSKGVLIEVPQGAINSSITIDVNTVGDISDLPLLENTAFFSDVFQITKSLPGDFNKPITLTFPFNVSTIDFDAYDIAIYWLDEETNTWMRLENIHVDPEQGTVSGEVDRFTKFAILATEIPYRVMEKEGTFTNDKVWTVKLTNEVDVSTIEDAFYIKDETGTLIPATYTSDGKEIFIHAPEAGYATTGAYTLYISTELKDVKGNPLKEPIKMTFVIALGEA